jgi:hypothetical protein
LGEQRQRIASVRRLDDVVASREKQRRRGEPRSIMIVDDQNQRLAGEKGLA